MAFRIGPLEETDLTLPVTSRLEYYNILYGAAFENILEM